MKKISIYLSVIFIFISLFSACEENKDGFYDNIPRIYFPQDSTNFSFGDKLMEYKRHIVLFPVKMMGQKATREMKFRVIVDEKNSTAKAGIHFTVLNKEYSLLIDSVNAYIPIELIRDNLSEEEVSYKIALQLETGADFETGVKESLSAVITYNNFLEEPSWWGSAIAAYAPNYKPGMYQRMIAYYGGPLEEGYVWEHYIEVITVFKLEVYDYAVQHPELDWQFGDDLWWPFA